MDQEEPVKIPPYKVLFIQNIPASYDSERLIKEWNVAGLVEVRLVPSKFVGFAEFEDEVRATAALEIIRTQSLSDGTRLVIDYAKR